MQGMLQDGIGAVIERLEQWDMPSRQMKTVGERARASGSISGGRWAGSLFCLVERCSAAFNVLENCSRNCSEGSSGEL